MAKKKKPAKGKLRYIGSIWENENKKGETFLSASIDNHKPDDKYFKGTLLWHDSEDNSYYKVKGMSVYDSDKGPENLTNKLVLDLESDYHVEELSNEEE